MIMKAVLALAALSMTVQAITRSTAAPTVVNPVDPRYTRTTQRVSNYYRRTTIAYGYA